MLDSLKIKNFRIFQDLEIDEVGRVNLVVGKNSSGKSCLLDALRVYASGANGLLLQQLVETRGEDLEVLNEIQFRRVETFEMQPASSPLCNLFHGYRFPRNLETIIEIGPSWADDKVNSTIKLAPAFFQDIIDPSGDEPIRRRRMKLGAGEALPPDAHFSLECIVSVDSEEIRSYPVPMADYASSARRFFARLAPIVPHHFVPAANMENHVIAELWSKISIRPKLKSHVISALKLINSQLVDLVMVASKRNEFEAVVVFDEDRRVPLRGLGDGMMRLFHIVVAVASAESGGLVLIDEFENGLHWSVQSKAWELVFHLSRELNLQIFATTHSWDCVTAFQENALINDNHTKGMLLHIGQSIRESKKGQVFVTRYSGESLQLANQAGLEVR